MPIAITRPVSPKMAECELTHLARDPIDVELAASQHAEYEKALQKLGCQVIQAGAAPELPDSVFVEDCAIVMEELAILTNPGAVSRKQEVQGLVEVLGPHRPLYFILPSGTLDGGDVLVIGKQIWVGRSSRSNQEGIDQMQAIVEPFGFSVEVIEVAGCLHLKSAVTQVADDTVLLNPQWIDASIFDQFRIIETDPDEPGAANALLIDGVVIFPVEYLVTAMYLAEAGIELLLVDTSEVIKGEGGVTCCSIVF